MATLLGLLFQTPPCPHCEGTGICTDEEYHSGSAAANHFATGDMECPYCDGTPLSPGNCPHCDGTGEAAE